MARRTIILLELLPMSVVTSSDLAASSVVAAVGVFLDAELFRLELLRTAIYR